jgi:hypothetical protein
MKTNLTFNLPLTFNLSPLTLISRRSNVMRTRFFIAAVALLVVCLFSFSAAEVPHMITFQGKLTTSEGVPVNDTVQMTFSIYSDTGGGTAQWTENGAQVVVKDGIYSVLLGQVISIPDSVFDGNVKYLGVKVGSDPEMRPLLPMVSAPYAFMSSKGGCCWDCTTPGFTYIADPNEKVGIGVTNPSWDLTFGYAITREIGVEEALMGDGTTLKIHAGNAFDDAITEHDGGDLYLYGGRQVWNGIDGDVILAHTGANPRGNVGIGTNNPTKKLDVAGTAKMTGFEMPTGASNGFVLTSNGTGVGTWAASATGPDQDWNYWTSPPNMFTIPTGNVGIGTTTPSSRLHVQNSTLAANEMAVQIGFGSAVDLVTGKGIVAESDLMTIKGARIGVIGKSTVNVSGNQGSAEGRMGQVVGYDANGMMDGVVGASNPSALDNNGATNTSFAVGGSFAAQPPAGMTLNATGTYKVGGVLATVGGQVDAAGSNAIVAGVIGEDNSTGSATSYAGYFTSNRTDSYDNTAVYGRCYPQTGWGVGGDFSGGYEGVRGYSDHIGVQGYVANGPASTECYGGHFQANGQSVTSIPYGVYGMANGTTGSTCYGVYGGASGSGPNIWAGYFNGRLYAQGNVGIGTTNPQGALDVSSTTGAFIVPRMTTAQRNALTPVNGMVIYNTTDNQFNFRENGAWVTK